MSKRSGPRLSRTENDIVDTPSEVVDILSAHLVPGTRISEPCAGANHLAKRLEHHVFQIAKAYDIAPRNKCVEEADIAKRPPRHLTVTNPPYGRKTRLPVMNALLEARAEAWLLIPTDWLTGHWFAPFASHVAEIVPVGRVSWMGNGVKGFDNSAWTRFDFGRTFEFLRPQS